MIPHGIYAATRHVMEVGGETADEMMFVCPACSRRVVVGKREPKLVVVDRGEFDVSHAGGVGLDVSVGPVR